MNRPEGPTAEGGVTPSKRVLHPVDLLKAQGFNFFTGVACSILAPLIKELEAGTPRYVPAVREDLAVGMAAGAYLAGARPVVLMQNSGLGYCLNVLTSLSLIYKIPALLVVGFRGSSTSDAPEHWVMGAHGRAVLETVGIKTVVPSLGEWAGALQQANAVIEKRKVPAAIFLRKGVLGG